MTSNNLTNDIALDHVGWAVDSIEDAIPALHALGFSAGGDIVEDESRSVRILIMRASGGQTVELISPLGNVRSPVSNFLLKSGPSPYHCCFEVKRELYAEQLALLKKSGFMEITKAAPAKALDGDDVVFLYSKHAGLIELVLR